ncbi:MAG TPA: VanW family protein [Geobacteraceae bacterium]|nr:VanW family protein [Geobacteraceae bacterium]
MQIHNAARAARDLDGVIIPPGGTFSFNEHVGSRDGGKGYLRAPMINDLGYMQDIPGGGICQLATTIYNAALYAGLEIAERHPHSRAVSYVPPGRDATIATWRKDLKLRNPHKSPLVLRIKMEDRRITVSFWSTEEKGFQVELKSDSIPLEPATATADSAAIAGSREQTGGKGFSVITKRIVTAGGKAREQTISRDFYPPPSNILKGDSQ